MDWLILPLKKYADFSGRSQRKEFWLFVLACTLIELALLYIDSSLGWYYPKVEEGVFSGIFSLATLLPTIALVARRLHDVGRSGWWQLLIFIPFLGAIVLLTFFIRDSYPNTNEYGPNPKATA